jgi:hypothetical protein
VNSPTRPASTGQPPRGQAHSPARLPGAATQAVDRAQVRSSDAPTNVGASSAPGRRRRRPRWFRGRKGTLPPPTPHARSTSSKHSRTSIALTAPCTARRSCGQSPDPTDSTGWTSIEVDSAASFTSTHVPPDLLERNVPHSRAEASNPKAAGNFCVTSRQPADDVTDCLNAYCMESCFCLRGRNRRPDTPPAVDPRTGRWLHNRPPPHKSRVGARVGQPADAHRAGRPLAAQSPAPHKSRVGARVRRQADVHRGGGEPTGAQWHR